MNSSKGLCKALFVYLTAKLNKWMLSSAIYIYNLLKAKGTVISLFFLQKPSSAAHHSCFRWDCNLFVGCCRKGKHCGSFVGAKLRYKTRVYPIAQQIGSISGWTQYLLKRGLRRTSRVMFWRPSMKEIGDWLDETYRTKIRIVVQANFYKGMFFLIFMKFSLLVST